MLKKLFKKKKKKKKKKEKMPYLLLLLGHPNSFLALKFEQVDFTTCWCVYNCWLSGKLLKKSSLLPVDVISKTIG